MEGYTIESAAFANAEHTAVVMQTEESGAVAVSAKDRPALWLHLQSWVSNGGEITAYVAPPPPEESND